MKTTIRRWGNSLAVRIPKSFAKEISVSEGSELQMRVAKGRIVLAPNSPREYHLGDLVAGINRHNLHDEIAAERAIGREVW